MSRFEYNSKRDHKYEIIYTVTSPLGVYSDSIIVTACKLKVWVSAAFGCACRFIPRDISYSYTVTEIPYFDSRPSEHVTCVDRVEQLFILSLLNSVFFPKSTSIPPRGINADDIIWDMCFSRPVF